MLPLPEIPKWLKKRHSNLKVVNFHSPSEVPEEEVGTLPTLCGDWEGGVFDGGPHMRSYWKPNSEEILALVNGAVIELTIIGDQMPPLVLNVEVEE